MISPFGKRKPRTSFYHHVPMAEDASLGPGLDTRVVEEGTVLRGQKREGWFLFS
jgi:hypothetical protein